MINLILIVVGLLVVSDIIITFFKKQKVQVDLLPVENLLKAEFDRLAKEIKDDNSRNKVEYINIFNGIKDDLSKGLKDNREELTQNFTNFQSQIESKFDSFSQRLNTMSEDIVKKLNDIKAENESKLNEFKNSITSSIDNLNKQLQDKLTDFAKNMQHISDVVIEKQDNIRKETETKLDSFRDQLTRSMDALSQSLANKLKEFNDDEKKNLDDIIKKQDEIRKETTEKLEKIDNTVMKSLKSLQEDNAQELEKMRDTVNQKLQTALDKKLRASFKQVSERLEAVREGLGEMKTLAAGVGDLKKVLTNVKNRGIIGEIQLGSILESVFSPDQYEKNVATVKGSSERVDFAIKLPGKDDNKRIYLPIDSKFPIEDYQRLLDAYDKGNIHKIESCRKELVNTIKRCAKTIHDKYINVPDTTDFGILFLPFEGLYAEVLQNTELVHFLQTQYQIVLAGPTTLAAFINSLEMGFKTLAIQRRSSEVWALLGAVKTQFNKFGETLQKAQKQLRGASDNLEELIGTRTRIIQNKLKNVQQLPEHQSQQLLDDNSLDDDVVEIENDN